MAGELKGGALKRPCSRCNAARAGQDLSKMNILYTIFPRCLTSKRKQRLTLPSFVASNLGVPKSPANLFVVASLIKPPVLILHICVYQSISDLNDRLKDI